MSILDAVMDVAKLQFVDEKEASRRLAICKECPRFNKVMQTCEICYCFLPAKVKLLNSTCPAAEPKW